MADDGGGAPELAPPPPPPLFPSYPEMILEAIDALDNDRGSNKTAISGYIKRKYGANLPTDHTSLLTTNLGRMKSAGEVAFSRNKYFRPDGDDEEGPSARPASLHPDGHTYPTVADDFFGIEEDADDGWMLVFAHSIVPDADADGRVPAPTLGMTANVFAPTTPGAAADDMDVPAPVPVVTTEATAACPVKRGRGRSSKPKDAVAEDYRGAPAETSFVAADAAAVPAKRGRGRPRPKPKDPVAEASVVAVADAPAMLAKRGRVRPPSPMTPLRLPSLPLTMPQPCLPSEAEAVDGHRNPKTPLP